MTDEEKEIAKRVAPKVCDLIFKQENISDYNIATSILFSVMATMFFTCIEQGIIDYGVEKDKLLETLDYMLFDARREKERGEK